jgi:LysM repeat protein
MSLTIRLSRIIEKMLYLGTSTDIGVKETNMNIEDVIKHARKLVMITVFTVTILAMMVAVVPNPVQAANNTQTTCAYKHTVVSGETLSLIAIQYGTTYLEIAEANNLKEPYTIYVGQVLCIPESATNIPGDGAGETPSEGAPSGQSFDVSFEDNYYIRLKVFNFPPQRSQIIKIGVWNSRWMDIEFEVVGRFRTDKGGNADIYQRLTKEYRDVPIAVCLKNPFTDKTVCDYFDPFIE